MRFFRNLCLLFSTVLITSTAWTKATTSLTGSETVTVSVEAEATKINTTDATFSVLLELNDALIRLNGKLERVSLRDITLVPRTSIIPQRTTDIKPTNTK